MASAINDEPVNDTTPLLRRWVVAFAGARDYYQVPLALQESGMLDRLVTDFYAPDLGRLERSPIGRFRNRRVSGLPIRRVIATPSVITRRIRNRDRSPRERAETWRAIDTSIARAAGRRAITHGSNLLLYKGYAREAFAMPGLEATTKGLFVYHPHGAYVRELLEQDAALYPEVAASFALHSAEIKINDSTRLDDELALADFVICASSFTARTLGACPKPGHVPLVVPYGVFANAGRRAERRTGSCRFLFVGQGVQRKGLHHLFRAWTSLGMRDAELIVVAAEIDTGIAAKAPQGVIVLGRQSREELSDLYRHADVFVMPSLVEGFGLVYLEALSAGCFTIGTANSGLPDLHCPPWAATVIDAGDIHSLAEAILSARDRHRRKEIPADEIIDFVSAYPWSQFRGRIREICAAR